MNTSNLASWLAVAFCLAAPLGWASCSGLHGKEHSDCSVAEHQMMERVIHQNQEDARKTLLTVEGPGGPVQWSLAKIQLGICDQAKQDGVYKVYYPSGKLQSVSGCKGQKLDGQTVRWDEGGRKRFEAHYEQGELNGVESVYDGGSLYEEINFVRGKKDGQSKVYYRSGRVKFSMHYHDDKLEGEHRFFYGGGQVKVLSHYRAGKLDGEILTFDPSGKLLAHELYKQGKKIQILNHKPER